MVAVEPTSEPAVYEVSLVVPVYQGERTLGALVSEVVPLTTPHRTPKGRMFRISELLLVHDGAVDGSAGVIKALSQEHDFVRPLWLSRNFGQHPATLAGMASTVGTWVATLDEDGQQDPRDVGALLDTALDESSRLVYASPKNPPPHGALRNAASKLAKWVAVRLLAVPIGAFNSFRLIEGEVARGVAAYCGANVYLDVALSWVVGKASHCKVMLREERGRRSGYTLQRLLRHFWQLVITSGTRPLRFISLLGMIAVVGSFAFSGISIYQRLQHQIPIPGWTSTIVVICLLAGLTLISLGIVAEYLAFAVGMAMGRPAYLIVSRPREDIARSS
ncbi:MAG: glycosyltransferase [Myxococcales bacterium]|nr:MAG: glycosyltransferase [Myxococcales bacterium]